MQYKNHKHFSFDISRSLLISISEIMESESNNMDKCKEGALYLYPEDQHSRERDITGVLGRYTEVQWEHVSYNNRVGQEGLPGSKSSEASDIKRLIGRQWPWLWSTAGNQKDPFKPMVTCSFPGSSDMSHITTIGHISPGSVGNTSKGCTFSSSGDMPMDNKHAFISRLCTKFGAFLFLFTSHSNPLKHAWM